LKVALLLNLLWGACGSIAPIPLGDRNDDHTEAILEIRSGVGRALRQIFADGGDDIGGQAPREGADIRRVGVRTHGEYWGAKGEQIDMLSGNLNYSLPLFQASGRNVTVDIQCSYNSQVWRKDGQNTNI
jgi:hypothetical protein